MSPWLQPRSADSTAEISRQEGMVKQHCPAHSGQEAGAGKQHHKWTGTGHMQYPGPLFMTDTDAPRNMLRYSAGNARIFLCTLYHFKITYNLNSSQIVVTQYCLGNRAKKKTLYMLSTGTNFSTIFNLHLIQSTGKEPMAIESCLYNPVFPNLIKTKIRKYAVQMCVHLTKEKDSITWFLIH